MSRDEIIQSLRAEITHLQRMLDLMEEVPSSASERRGPGRARGTVGWVASVTSGSPSPQKRGMSAEGKAHIADAQKKQWAMPKRAKASDSQKGESLVPATGSRSKASKTPTNRGLPGRRL